MLGGGGSDQATVATVSVALRMMSDRGAYDQGHYGAFGRKPTKALLNLSLLQRRNFGFCVVDFNLFYHRTLRELLRV